MALHSNASCFRLKYRPRWGWGCGLFSTGLGFELLLLLACNINTSWDGVTRLSLGRCLVILLSVVKRTNTL